MVRGFEVEGWRGESVRRRTSYLMLRGDSEEAQKEKRDEDVLRVKNE